MKIIFLSDIHLGKDTNYPAIGGPDYINTFGSQFPELLSKISNEITKVDLVINIGDAIADEGMEKDEETYKKFVELLKSFSVPVKHVIGNHDARWLTREQLSAITNQPKNYFSFDLGDHHHIILDGRFNGYPFAIDDAQMDWLKDDLEKTTLPTIIYLHYPCDEQDTSKNYYYFHDQKDRIFIKQKTELRKLFETSGKVRLVMGGHTHFFHQSLINGITYVTVPSFTENDGTGKPGGLFVLIDMEPDKKVTIDLKHV